MIFFFDNTMFLLLAMIAGSIIVLAATSGTVFFRGSDKKSEPETIDEIVEEKFTDRQIKKTKIGAERDLVSREDRKPETMHEALLHFAT